MHIKAILVLFAVAWLGGCMPQTTWFQRDKTDEQTNKDQSECQQQLASTKRGEKPATEYALPRGSTFEECMESKGYMLRRR